VDPNFHGFVIISLKPILPSQLTSNCISHPEISADSSPMTAWKCRPGQDKLK